MKEPRPGLHCEELDLILAQEINTHPRTLSVTKRIVTLSFVPPVLTTSRRGGFTKL
jgi:hypothetical protein